MSEDNPFIFVTTQIAHTVVSDAAMRRGMTVAQYVSLAISRQIADDKDAGQASQNPEEST